MKVVAITGISGFLGTCLVEQLAKKPSVEKIIGFDLKPLTVSCDKVEFFQLDILNPAIEKILQQKQVDTLIHLAFVLVPLRDKKRYYDIDVNGSNHVLESAAHAHIKKIILTSSTSVYGVHPDNPPLMDEAQPLRPNPDFEYAVHKKAVEAICELFRGRHPEITLTIFRPCMILGPHMDNIVCEMARKLPRIVTLRGYAPVFQFVHEDDVVSALVMALHNDMQGVFNLVGTGTIDMKEFCTIFNKRSISVSFPLLYRLHSILWALNVPGITLKPGALQYLRYPSLASGEKINRMFSFQPVFTSRDALKSHVAAYSHT